MKKVSKAVKTSIIGVVASAMLALPVSAQTMSSAEQQVREGTTSGRIIFQNPFQLYLGDVSLIYPGYATEMRELPAKFKNNVQSVTISSTSVGASMIKAEIINGTHIKFSTGTAYKVYATVYITHTDGTKGYYSLSSRAIY